jgi:adenylylsulfate kinase
MSKEKKTICVDFDGVIAEYEGYEGDDKFGEPVDGVQNALKVLKEHNYTIIVFTTRKNTAALRKYLKENDITYDYINENPDQPKNSNSGKPVADVYLDDRAVCFHGNWKWALQDIASFKPYNNEKENQKETYKKAFDEYLEMAKKSIG